MLTQAALWDAEFGVPLSDVVPLGAFLAWLPHSDSGATVLHAPPGDALGAVPPHEHDRACANGERGGDGQMQVVPNEKVLSGMQVPESARMRTLQM
jgi:hypothetical protein